MTIRGRCQCGAVEYELAKPPRRASICHCRMCQRATGSYFAPLANVEIDDFKLVKGELTTYRSSALAERGFCRDCGSPLTFRYVELPDISVTIGSLDDPELISPSKQYGTESTVRCFSDLSSLPGKSTQEAMPAGWLERIEGGGS